MVGAKRFLTLAARLPAYQSVMAARMAVEDPQQAAAPATPTEADEVPIDAMNLLVPGLIERVEV